MTKRREMARLAKAWVAVIGLLAIAMPSAADATVTGTPAATFPWAVDGVRDIDLDPATGLFHLVRSVNSEVTIHDITGAQVGVYGAGVVVQPLGVGLTENRFYVTSEANRVEMFQRHTGTHLGGWGSAGSAAGQFNTPWGIEAFGNEIYVVDLGNSRVQVFTADGVWTRTIDAAGTAFELAGPTGLAFHNGTLYVLEGFGRVVVFDPTTGVASSSFSVVAFGQDIEITTAGDVFVSASGSGQGAVSVYTTGGALQTTFDPGPVGDGLAVDPSGESVWVAGVGSNYVWPHTYLTCTGLVPNIVGTSYADVVQLSFADDVVALGPGDDDVRLAGGDDTACGGAGIDTIRGDSGDDIIYGGLSPDKLIGGAGVDVLYGEAGADELRGGGGGDSLFGGDGPDTIKGQGGSDFIVGGAAGDKIDGQGAADIIDGGTGNDIINGQNGADIIYGWEGKDTLKGQTGPDEIHGEAGDDELTGGDGADVLYGGAGFDRCSGNTGPDSAEAATCEQTPGVETLF